MITKILLDTDIGDDIDDSFALALLSKTAGENLIGVTTVFRNTSDRAQQALQLLKKLNVTVPVYAGERLPIKEPIRFFNKDNDTPPENQHPCQWSEEYGDYPVYLFDDVQSELDASRRDYLTERIKKRQVILTTCEPSEQKRHGEANVISVKNGTFEQK